MRVEVADVAPLRFADGSPVRAASAITAYGAGWLVAQDDATHACWLRDGVGSRIRVLPAVSGHELFAETEGTKHLKPDLEAACAVPGGVLLLGSGSTAERMRAVLLRVGEQPAVVADLSSVYARVAAALAVPPADLNLEGACVVGSALRWFQRGRPAGGLPSASVDLDLAALLDVVIGGADAASLVVREMRTYDLGAVDGIGLAITDAVSLGDQTVLVSAAAEDSPNAYDDGPIVGAALAILDGSELREVGRLPRVEGRVAKIEGLALLDWSDAGGRLLATVDQDDPALASSLLTLDVRN